MAVAPVQQCAPEMPFAPCRHQRAADKAVAVHPVRQIGRGIAVIACLPQQRDDAGHDPVTFQYQPGEFAIGVKGALGGQRIPAFKEGVGFGGASRQRVPAGDVIRRRQFGGRAQVQGKRIGPAVHGWPDGQNAVRFQCRCRQAR